MTVLQFGHAETIAALTRELEQVRKERDLAEDQAEVNAQTIAQLRWQNQRDTKELYRHMATIERKYDDLCNELCEVLVEYKPDYWTSLELLLADPEKYGARKRCSNPEHDFDCTGEHAR